VALAPCAARLLPFLRRLALVVGAVGSFLSSLASSSRRKEEEAERAGLLFSASSSASHSASQSSSLLAVALRRLSAAGVAEAAGVSEAAGVAEATGVAEAAGVAEAVPGSCRVPTIAAGFVVSPAAIDSPLPLATLVEAVTDGGGSPTLRGPLAGAEGPVVVASGERSTGEAADGLCRREPSAMPSTLSPSTFESGAGVDRGKKLVGSGSRISASRLRSHAGVSVVAGDGALAETDGRDC